MNQQHLHDTAQHVTTHVAGVSDHPAISAMVSCLFFIVSIFLTIASNDLQTLHIPPIVIECAQIGAAVGAMIAAFFSIRANRRIRKQREKEKSKSE